MSAIINAKYYAEAGAFVSKDKSRYVLHAIRIEPHPDGGAVIVATDGHTMGLFHDADAICDRVMQVEFRKEIARFCVATGKVDKTAFVRRMQIEDKHLDIVETLEGSDYAEEPISKIVRFFDTHAEGEFPNWRMVLPSAPAESHLDFNAEYLMRGAASKNAPGVSVWAEKPDAQAVVRSSREDFIAIVMPMKGFTESPYPAYVRALIARRKEVTTVEVDDPSLFGELEKAETEPAPKVVKGNGNGKAATPTINVNLEKKCSSCGKKGATETGKCIECGGADKVMTEVVTKALEPLRETVAKKRGRSAAARV